MLRRARNEQREAVVVELVDPVSADSMPFDSMPVDPMRFDSIPFGSMPDSIPANSMSRAPVEPDDHRAANTPASAIGPTGGGNGSGSIPTRPGVAANLNAADDARPVDTEPTKTHTFSKRQRSVRWSAVALIAVLLVGVVGWMLLREPDPGTALPWIPANPTEEYNWRIERVAPSQVSVSGTADRAYVLAANERSGSLDALDADGAPRWTTALPGAWYWGESTIVDGNVLVATVGPATDDPTSDATGPPVHQTTLTLIDDADGSIVWQTDVLGSYRGVFDDRIIVADYEPIIFEADFDTSDGEGSVVDLPSVPAVRVSSVDIASGTVTATERFDQLSEPGLPETAESEASAFAAAVRDGEVFALSPALQPTSTPVEVNDEVLIGYNGQYVLTIDDGTVTAYDSSGGVVATGSRPDATIANTYSLVGLDNGVWTYTAGSPSDQPMCGAFRLDDAGMTELWQRDDCFVWTSSQLDDGTTVAVLIEATLATDDDYADTVALIDLVDGTERASGRDAEIGANGFVFNRDGVLTVTSLSSSTPRVEIELPKNSDWFLLDGGIAIVEPDNSGSVNAVSLTMYR